MAIKKVSVGKIVIAIFLTALIWVWADLAQDAKITLANLIISVARNTDPTLWVTFKTDGSSLKSSATIDAVTLQGPASRIAEVERMRNTGSLEREVFFVPETEDVTEPGEHVLDICSFLKQSDMVRKLGLTVESCQPRTVVVAVVKLTEKSLSVECVDESGGSLNPASIEPAKVNAFVPADGTFTAKIQLTAAELSQARVAPIKKTPYVELAQGQTRPVAGSVRIKMPLADETLGEHTITSATLGFCLSEVLQGKFKVEVLNPADLATVVIRATPAARQAYEQQPFQMLLHVLDEDRRAAAELRRSVVLNFPEEFVRKGEITAAQQPPQVRFKLSPVATETPIESTGAGPTQLQPEKPR